MISPYYDIYLRTLNMHMHTASSHTWLHPAQLFLLTVLWLLQLLAFDELKTDHKNPLDTCKELNPVRCRCLAS